jgi:predicted glycogen debranching enzyme
MAEGLVDTTDPEASLGLEWLATNGLGGYAMGTALGANTRRYHGLLVAALRPPIDRALLLHSIIEQIIDGDQTIDLSTHEFASVSLHPQGWRQLVEFNHKPPSAATWHYRAAGFEIHKQVCLSSARNEVAVTYELSGVDRPIMLRLRPLTPLRGFHDLVDAGEDEPEATTSAGNELVASRAELQVTLETDRGTVHIDPQWWRGLVYREDQRRGQGFQEDVWSPGVIEVPLEPDGMNRVVLKARASDEDRETLTSVARSQKQVHSGPSTPPSPRQRLRVAASQFLVHRTEPDQIGFSIIAGYPWFADWGRDAMICVPGLLLTNNRLFEARSTLHTFARHMKQGIIPNRFDDRTGEPHYNTVDASLWFVNAVYAYSQALPQAQQAHASDLIESCRSIIEAYRTGQAPGVSIGQECLITAGSPGEQLTWMDAMRDGTVYTSRYGQPIEINALWHNALCCMERLSQSEQERASLRELSEHVARTMQTAFWWTQRNCCHDVLVPDGDGWVGDGRLRPNQIIAVSLSFSPLTKAQQRDVVNVVRQRLLTPFGLRTLDPDDPKYHGRYEGNMNQRDAAYHQGTVWPWLMGPFGEALLRVDDFSDAARRQVEELLEPLLDQLDSGCLGQLAEIYDGDPPHRPSGCPAQAWSVAEILRLLTLAHKPSRDPQPVATLES